jgi:histidyl-tRNA synthetase
MSQTISTQPYKGTRDFYPEQLQKRNYIFAKWREVLTKKGFLEYETSLLENAEIYIAKSGQELGASQLYNFYDKGERFVALRPEQTPSLARMVANNFGEIRLPVRWFSIPNCFRYERPQKGRLREHWQLNADVIGLEPGFIELEILNLVGELFKSFGANKNHFAINFNHRGLLDSWLEEYGLLENKSLIYKVLDDWYKDSIDENKTLLTAELTPTQVENIMNLAQKNGKEWEDYLNKAHEYKEIKLILAHIGQLQPDLEYVLNPCIIRGIAYYTGIVFEAFDKNPENPRALFGGGRYDNLMELFGKHAPAIGFGWGDVTMDEFLTGHNLYPDFQKNVNKIGVMLMDESEIGKLYHEILPKLETEGKLAIIDYEISRSENKRYEALKKRGCGEIVKV